jgi:hypothetical protein
MMRNIYLPNRRSTAAGALDSSHTDLALALASE